MSSSSGFDPAPVRATAEWESQLGILKWPKVTRERLSAKRTVLSWCGRPHATAAPSRTPSSQMQKLQDHVGRQQLSRAWPTERSPLICPLGNKGGHHHHAHFTERKPRIKQGPRRSGQPSGPGPRVPSLSQRAPPQHSHSLPSPCFLQQDGGQGHQLSVIPLHNGPGRARGTVLLNSWLCLGSVQTGRVNSTPQPLTSVPLRSRNGAGDPEAF